MMGAIMKRLVGAIFVLTSAILFGAAEIAIAVGPSTNDLLPAISVLASIILAMAGLAMIALGMAYRDDL